MRRAIVAVAAVLLMAATLYVPREASAIPAFARQTGMACNTCHFQHFPLLNQFGRDFKAKGFTMVGGQSLVEGEMLSLPSVLNASLITKTRYQKTNGNDNNTGTNKGELQFPDEAALMVGGRVGEHIGFILEAQMANEAAPMFASFKMPIGFEVGEAHLEIIPFTTDALGPQFSFELLNTGALRSIRALEHAADTSAVAHLGLNGNAQGVGIAAYHNTGYISYAAWQPETGTSAGDVLNYVRLVATPTIIDGWDTAAGVQWWGGTAKLNSGSVYTKRDAFAFDAQAQGLVGNYPLGVYFQYAKANKSNTGETANAFNTGTNDDKSATSIVAELGIIPNKATVSLGYLSGDTGATANNKKTSLTVGATYLLAQNFELQANYSKRGGSFYDLPANNENADGDTLTTFMIFAAF